MREALKQILSGRGAPVLQTRKDGEEVILSAGNIWTSAHARRIELRDRGLVPGAVLCCDTGGFQAVIDFVACAIGGFIYFPVTSQCLRSLQQQAAFSSVASRTGILFVSEASACHYRSDRLPACLSAVESIDGAVLILQAMPGGRAIQPWIFTGSEIEDQLESLSVKWGTREHGARLSYHTANNDVGFVTDLLLGIRNRQTIYLRNGAETSPLDMIREVIDLDIDDLVLAPEMLDQLCSEPLRLTASCREALKKVRCHIAGQSLSSRSSWKGMRLFEQVLVGHGLLADRGCDARRSAVL